MKWIKEVVVDILAVGLILAAVLTNHPGFVVLLYVYTGFLVLVRVAIFATRDKSPGKVKKQKAPQWVHHVLYALSAGTLLWFQWFITGGAWVLIWVLSWLYQRSIDRRGK